MTGAGNALLRVAVSRPEVLLEPSRVMPNNAFERSAQRRCCCVPSSLRASAAAQPRRSAWLCRPH